MKEFKKQTTELYLSHRSGLRYNDLPKVSDYLEKDVRKLQPRLSQTVEYRGCVGQYEWIEDLRFFYGIALDPEKLHPIVFEGEDSEELLVSFKDAVDEYIDVA